eukprot:gene2294-4461_t
MVKFIKFEDADQHSNDWVIITVITLLIFAYPSYQWEVHDEVYLAVHVLVYAVPFLLMNISNDAENIQLFDDIMRSFDIAVNILDNMLTSDHLETQALVLNKSEFHIWDFLNETVRPFVLH